MFELYYFFHNIIITGVLKRGNWGASETERALKIILSFAKANGGEKWGLENGNIHIKLLDTAKKEFRVSRLLAANQF